MTHADHTTATTDSLITERDAAAVLGMSVAWMQRDRWIGPTVPYVRLGRAVRYVPEDLRRIIAARRVEARS